MKKNNESWQPIGVVARRLREKSVEALNLGQFEVSEAYHVKALNMEIEAWLKEREE